MINIEVIVDSLISFTYLSLSWESHPIDSCAWTFHEPVSPRDPESLRCVLGWRPKCEHFGQGWLPESHCPCVQVSRPTGVAQGFSVKQRVVGKNLVINI